ncbi:Uncharacterised protein [uncultured archaeon]|nr:Uncharacterised protein [uncultured archaeon]
MFTIGKLKKSSLDLHLSNKKVHNGISGLCEIPIIREMLIEYYLNI